MKYGINVPNFGDYFHPRTLSELARDAEDSGWDGFFIWDHIVGDVSFADPTVALAAIALNTDRIRLGTMVTPLPRRRPWKIARETVSLDHLSEGRLILGVGLGYPPSEFEAFGENGEAKTRAGKLDEGLKVLTGLWTGEPFSYKGEHYQVDEVTFLPKPFQSPRIPIWTACFWPNRKPLLRAARYEGVVPARSWPQTLTPEDVSDIIEFINNNRSSSAIFDVMAGGETPPDPDKGAELVEPYIEAGATWWSENINGWRGTLDEMRDRIRQGPPKV